jgi:hypothetical protein
VYAPVVIAEVAPLTISMSFTAAAVVSSSMKYALFGSV